MNEWINKYKYENIQPNGYQKHGKFICKNYWSGFGIP